MNYKLENTLVDLLKLKIDKLAEVKYNSASFMILLCQNIKTINI